MTYKKELETNLEVVKVFYQPYCESTWTLKHKDVGVFCLDEKIFETTEDDELLIGKNISAIVEISGYVIGLGNKKRHVELKGNYFNVVGGQIRKIYEDGESKEYFLDSIFPISLTLNSPKNQFAELKIGDWVQVKYDGISGLILPRGKNLK